MVMLMPMKAIRHSPVSDHTITANCMDMYNAPKPVSLEIFSIRIVFIIFSVQSKQLMMGFRGGIISGSDHTVIISKLTRFSGRDLKRLQNFLLNHGSIIQYSIFLYATSQEHLDIV